MCEIAVLYDYSLGVSTVISDESGFNMPTVYQFNVAK